MLRAEKLKTESSVKIKEYGSNSKKTTLRSRQKGSILIGIIITMVIMASLGAGMVYLTTTSTFQGLFGNNQARAYYAAESGGRYAMAEIRYAYTTSLASLETNLQKTFNIGNGGSFEIKNISLNGGNPETVTFDSIGTVGSGFMTAKRQIKYSITPANQSLGGQITEYSTNEIDTTQGIVKGSFSTGTDGSIHVATTVDDGNNQDFAAAYFKSAVNFLNEWNAQNHFLSYNAQVKVKSEADYFAAGLGTRLHTVCDANGTTNCRPRGFHVSFMRVNGGLNNYDGIPYASGELKCPDYTGYSYLDPDCHINTLEGGANYIILWMDDLTVNNRFNWETLLAYKKLDSTSGVVETALFPLDTMEYVGLDRNGWTVDTSNPWGWDSDDSYSATHSWNIDIEHVLGITSTLKSKQIGVSGISSGILSFRYKVRNLEHGATAKVWICSNATTCTDLSSSFSPVIDDAWHSAAISVTGLISTSFIKFVATTSSSDTDTRVRCYVDDVKLAVPNWSTILVGLEEKNVTNVTDTDKRRNVIKVYYSTPTSNPPGTINWPPATGITPVTWTWVKGDDPTRVDVIADKTVVQTKYYRTIASGTTPPDTTTGWYNVTNAYDEVGLTVFGKSAAVNNHVFFQDFTLRIGGGGGNLDGSGDVVQY
jgi:Tfp pilus assembly protein PilX